MWLNCWTKLQPWGRHPPLQWLPLTQPPSSCPPSPPRPPTPENFLIIFVTTLSNFYHTKKNRHAKASKQAKRSDHKHYLRGNYLRGKRLKLFPNPFLPVVFNWENLKVVLSWNWKKSDILNLRLRDLIKNVWNVYRTVISWKSSALLPEHANVQCNPSTKSSTSTSVYLLSLLLGLFSWLLALAHSRLRHHPHSTNLYLKSFIISIPFGKILFGQEHARPSGRWLQRRSSSQDFLGAL